MSRPVRLVVVAVLSAKQVQVQTGAAMLCAQPGAPRTPRCRLLPIARTRSAGAKGSAGRAAITLVMHAQRESKSFEIACRFIPICNYMRDLGTQILICRGSVLGHNNLWSIKARGCLPSLGASSSALETDNLVAEVGTSPTSVARAYHSRISAKKLSECMQMQNRIPMTL